MEYYTKSEGLGFLIGESRIDFRIEFRGVSILCEFNSLIWLVPHDSCDMATNKLFRQYRWFNVFKFKWPKMTTRWSYRESGTSAWRCLKQYDCKMVLQRWVCQMSKGGFWSSPSRRRKGLKESCILPSRKLSIQKSIETKWSWMTIDDYLQGPTWPFKTVWVNHWSQIQMVRYGRDGLNNDLTNVRNEHPFKPSHFNPSFRFSPCRT